MSATSVDLGNITVTGGKADFLVSLSSSISISLPAAPSIPASAVELSLASKAGDLWIAKAGACQLDFLTLINGEPLDCTTIGKDVASTIINLAADCPVWDAIDLDLRTKHSALLDGPGQQASQAHYFLCHPNLSSDMIAPSDIPTAKFHGLSCKINFRLINNRPDIEEASDNSATQPLGCVQPEQTPSRYNLRATPKPSKKALDAYEEIAAPSAEELISHSGLLFGEREPEVLTLSAISETTVVEMAFLLDAALRRLVGIKRTAIATGLKVINSPQCTPLIDIAPAVWNRRYLESITAHARVIPVISESISRLQHARSSALREKLKLLANSTMSRRTRATKPGNEQDVSKGISKRLWSLCQTGISVEPTSRIRGRKAAAQPAVEGSQPDTYIPSDIVMMGYEMDIVGELFEGDVITYEEADQLVMEPVDSFSSSQWLSEPGGIHQQYGSPGFEDHYPHVQDRGRKTDSLVSSEADYFYTDGYGNIYPVDTLEVQDPSQLAPQADLQEADLVDEYCEGWQEAEVYGENEEYADDVYYDGSHEMVMYGEEMIEKYDHGYG